MTVQAVNEDVSDRADMGSKLAVHGVGQAVQTVFGGSTCERSLFW